MDNVTIARSLQRLLGEFMYGIEPLVAEDGTKWPPYDAGSFLNITASGLIIENLDSGEARRCAVINEIFANQENGI